MTRAALQALLGAVLVLTVLALAGCRRLDVLQAEAQQRQAAIYVDQETGCEYFAHLESGPRFIPTTPRIATDGKTHMGCKAVQP